MLFEFEVGLDWFVSVETLELEVLLGGSVLFVFVEEEVEVLLGGSVLFVFVETEELEVLLGGSVLFVFVETE